MQQGVSGRMIKASDFLLLDSDVMHGGGTDETQKVQELLDLAPTLGGVYLIMDGAALVSRLRIHSNTTIFCLNTACGFFQIAGTNNALLENSGLSFTEIGCENIALIGGTYNFNSPGQEREDLPEDAFQCRSVYSLGDPGFNTETGFHRLQHTHMGFKFCGVRNLVLRNLKTVNQRIYAMWFMCFEHILIENIAIELPDNRHGQNQDGLHFHGPGRDLTIRNIRGCSGDDFIALAPDEFDLVSDITDVLIDGVYLENADQGIRLLSRGTGRLDRVTIRNVYGTYKSFGFFITPWYGAHLGEGKGNFGAISFENIDLASTAHKYDYMEPVLFLVAGQIDVLSLKNIRHLNTRDARRLLEVGGYRRRPQDEHSFADIGLLEVDGLCVLGREESGVPSECIRVEARVRRMIVKNITACLKGDKAPNAILTVCKGGQIGDLHLENIYTDRSVEAVAVNGGEIVRLHAWDNQNDRQITV